MAVLKEGFEDITRQSETIDNFFRTKKITAEPQKIESRWRSANIIYQIDTVEGTFILKKVNQEDFDAELDHLDNLVKIYPDFSPKVYVKDGPSVVMEFIDGEDLATVLQKPFSQAFPQIEEMGRHLRAVYSPQIGSMGEAQALSQIAYTYKYSQFDPQPGERLSPVVALWEENLNGYPAQVIHNDLNSTNTLITPEGKVRSIDPRADTKQLRDLAKDLGRLMASSICASHDSGYLPEQTRQIADAVIKPWEDVNHGLPERTAFYVGQDRK